MTNIFMGNNCKEQNIFMAIFEDVSEDNVEAPLMAESPEPTKMNPPSDPPKLN
jgi:hypothetical protein